MDKITYLAELAEGLARWVPQRERQDILRYYAEYFEEAGPQREAEVVAELGDPWALSCRLAVEGGYVTPEGAASWTPKKKRRIWAWGLAASLGVVVGLASMAVPALVGVGQYIWRDSVTVCAEPSVAEAVPGVVFSDRGVTCIESEEIAGGFWTMEDGSLESFGSIDADISLGSVMVTEGEDYTLYIGQNRTLGGYSLKWEVKNGALRIRDGSSGGIDLSNLDDLKHMFSLNGSAVEVVVTVPSAAALDKIDIKTDLGNVYLSGVYAGKVEAKTDLGNVECYDARVEKKLDLKTDLGNVDLSMEELWDGVDIKLETSMGNVEASLGCPETDCAYELETDLGSVSINGDSQGGDSKVKRKGSYPYKLDAESSMGSVNVYFCG